MSQTEEQLSKEIASRIRDAELEVKERSDKIAKDILVQAMQRMAGDFVAEQTNSTVHLPDDSMKGRIIGREVATFVPLRVLTGVDVIIDDTPEVVTLSGFDPIRREIARMTMESLLKDGRIHPARIEELVEKNRQEIDNRIREYGEAAAYEIGAPNLHPDLMKIMGRLQFRTSYGQIVCVTPLKLPNFLVLLLASWVKMLPWHDVQDSYMISEKRLTVKWKEVTSRLELNWHGSTRNTQWLSILLPVTMEMWNLKVLSQSLSLQLMP